MDLIVERCPILIELSTSVGLSVPFEQRVALVELVRRLPEGAVWHVIAIGRANLDIFP
jgi:uncharacterized protein (DUF849 family)